MFNSTTIRQMEIGNKDKMKADFCLEIDFDKHSENPSRVFKTMTELIESFQTIDKILVSSVDTKIDTILMLEDIESGSLRSWLVNVLKAVDDDALKNMDWKRQVGKYLLKGKYFLIDFLDKRTIISDKDEIISLQSELLKAAEETGVRHIPTYEQITPAKLIESIGNINQAVGNLSPKDKAKYISAEGKASFNIQFSFVPEDIEDLLTKETIEYKSEMILKVKKPDYLGISKWEFKYENRIIAVKIEDDRWLDKFQRRKKDVRPGDALRAIVKTKVKYGYDSAVVGINYEAVKILEIIRGDDSSAQLLLKE